MKKDKGFSLVELLVVAAIIVVISVISVPIFQQINSNYKLNAAGHSVASVIQQARLQAVASNQPSYANFNTANPVIVFVNGDPTVAYAQGNPDVSLGSGFSFQTTGLPTGGDGQLREYLGITGNAATDPDLQLNTAIGFNGRGLPCTNTSPGTPAVCPQQTGSGVAVFEWLITNGNNGWEAVTVTAAGRIKSWRMSGLDPSKTKCGFTACWQ